MKASVQEPDPFFTKAGSAMDVAILPSRGTSPETAAKGAGAANSLLCLTDLMAKWCPAWGESVARYAWGKCLVR